ncbi:MAG: hypothetical protein J6N52_11390 [Clostridia bacterium]|nr:hypothetical protein [Clostridia bacterium]
MEDISRISKKIIDDARLEAEEIMSAEIAKAQERAKDTAARLEAEKALIDADTERQLAAVCGSSEYEAEKNRKNALTKTRLDFFSHVTELAKQKLVSLPEKEYFDFLYNVFAKLGKGENGVISFGDKDAERLPVDFMERLEKLVPLSRGEDVPGYGFLVRYDGFTENAMLDQMLEERRSELIHELSMAIGS